MARPKLLIVGDSFCHSQDPKSWTQMIPDYEVVVDSSCGISEYKIWQNLLAHKLGDFDKLILVHTSPYRLYINKNPFYIDSDTHRNADLIYQDIKNKPPGKFKDLVCSWFEQVVDLTHLENINQLIIKEIQSCCVDIPTVHLTFFEHSLSNLHTINNIWKQNSGNINHMNETGNLLVVDFLNSFLYQ